METVGGQTDGLMASETCMGIQSTVKSAAAMLQLVTHSLLYENLHYQATVGL